MDAITLQKDFYSTREVADLIGVTQHTVQVRWCSNARIEAEKDPAPGEFPVMSMNGSAGVENHDRLDRLSC